MRPRQKLLLSCVLAVALAHASTAYEPAQALVPRQSLPISIPPASTTQASSTSTSTEASSTSASSTQSASDTSTTAKDTSTTPPPNTSNTSTQTTSTTPPPQSTTNTTAAQQTSEITTTDAEGQVSTLTVTSTSSGSASSTSSAAPSSSSSADTSGGGLGTGSIIGMSVAGGVAVIGIVAFFVWKFTRKRFSDFDDNEAIKWPELNSHSAPAESHPLPVHSTGRAGFETGSETDLTHPDSASNYSTPDFGAGSQDPYAVPPLPHMNPNQPYRDDPTAASGYYDPYRGPIPGTLEHGPAADWGAEAIPMNQMSAGRMSPGPQAAYSGEQMYGADPMFDPGRRSPGPQAAFAGRTSPGPQAAYAGRTSPGPQAAYTGRTSPGPQAAYTGRTSPGPQAAFAGRTSPGPEAAYGGRGSPGPHAAYDTYGAR